MIVRIENEHEHVQVVHVRARVFVIILSFHELLLDVLINVDIDLLVVYATEENKGSVSIFTKLILLYLISIFLDQCVVLILFPHVQPEQFLREYESHPNVSCELVLLAISELLVRFFVVQFPLL